MSYCPLTEEDRIVMVYVYRKLTRLALYNIIIANQLDAKIFQTLEKSREDLRRISRMDPTAR